MKRQNKSYPIGNRARKRLKAFSSEKNEVFYAFMVKNAFFGVFSIFKRVTSKKAAIEFLKKNFGRPLGRNLSSAPKIWTQNNRAQRLAIISDFVRLRMSNKEDTPTLCENITFE